MTILDGKARSAEIRLIIAERVAAYKGVAGRSPTLAVILVGDNPASQVYVQSKERAAEKVGISTRDIRLAASVSNTDVLSEISHLNADTSIDGILLQLPLPSHLDTELLLAAIDVEKDVDGLHPHNQGLLMRGMARFEPCTPKGVVDLIELGCERSSQVMSGLHAVVVGRSVLVGRPLGQMLLTRNCTVTQCHSKSRNLAEICRHGDILVAAVGRARMFGPEYVKEGAIVIDVGINRLPDGKLCGDVDFDAVKDRAAALSPVPGGVGPMTISMLLQNTVQAAERRTLQSRALNQTALSERGVR